MCAQLVLLGSNLAQPEENHSEQWNISFLLYEFVEPGNQSVQCYNVRLPEKCSMRVQCSTQKSSGLLRLRSSCVHQVATFAKVARVRLFSNHAHFVYSILPRKQAAGESPEAGATVCCKLSLVLVMALAMSLDEAMEPEWAALQESAACLTGSSLKSSKFEGGPKKCYHDWRTSSTTTIRLVWLNFKCSSKEYPHHTSDSLATCWLLTPSAAALGYRGAAGCCS